MSTRIDYVHLPRRLLWRENAYRIGQWLGSAIGGTLTLVLLHYLLFWLAGGAV